MNKAKPVILILLLLLFSLSSTGCLGKREINDLALVMAVGIDKGKKPGTVMVTAQIARPADARGQTGAPSGGTGEPIWSATAEGKSVFEAIRNLGRYSSRRVFWAHNFIIIIGADMAKQGIGEIIDFFTRNHELRMRTWVVVTPGKASQLVSTQTGLEVIPGEAMDNLFRYSEIVSSAPRSDMRTLQAAYLSDSTHPTLAKVQLKSREISNKKPGQFGSIKQVELAGAAVFNKDKMVGWLSPEETRGMLWFTEKVESGVIAIPCPDNRKKNATLEMKQQKIRVTPSYQKGQPSFTVEATSYADLVESGCEPQDQAALLQTLEGKLKDRLYSEIHGVVGKAQKTYKVDFLNLGKVFQNTYPVEWRSLRQTWTEEFPKAAVNVNVTTHIHSTVLLKRMTKSGKGGK
jgi:spore germination protein KC